MKEAKLAVLKQISDLARAEIKRSLKPDAEGEPCPDCGQSPCECDEAEQDAEALDLKDPQGNGYDDEGNSEDDPTDDSDKSKLLKFKKALGKG